MFIKVIYQEKTLTQALNSKMSESGIKIFNWLVDQMRSKPSIKDSIKNISIALGLSERTIQKWLSYFKDLGLITKEQLYGIYSHNTITLNRGIFQFARYFKYRFESLWRYLVFVYLRPTKKPCTPYIEEDVFINPSISISISRDSVKPYGFNTRGLKNLKREEMISIMEVAPPKISPTLQEITNKLRLNKLGQLKLLVFHEDILSEAWADYKKLTNVNHPFDYLVVSCIQKSENRSIPVYWDLFYTTCSRYGLKDNKVYIQSRPAPAVAVQSDYVPARPHADKKEPHKLFAEFFKIAQENSSL